MKKDLSDQSQTQQERLAYIELNLWFLGEIRRQSLVTRFQIKASATRDPCPVRKPSAAKYALRHQRQDVFHRSRL